ncbi:hypothetical protein [Marinobacterium sediminicola]|uniref:DUF3311 domain-containing protein n=1 Tax=Marinobacterium sediminicola TaxID=518898 RepID=A0ABY1RWA5_9GAMM|nr:hypothetical protein [Marinobacterium sediminicola]ULG70383.1 hypothetical protein LN244_06095 [Marinobacterium sediminicola]SMR69535.1 hypothetical protein SAMN04487964_101281 [Marinobacterium sediminicola]
MKPIMTGRLVALSLLALALFSPPLLLLFDRPTGWGFSSLPVVIYLIWAGLILLAGLVLERPDAD